MYKLIEGPKGGKGTEGTEDTKGINGPHVSYRNAKFPLIRATLGYGASHVNAVSLLDYT